MYAFRDGRLELLSWGPVPRPRAPKARIQARIAWIASLSRLGVLDSRGRLRWPILNPFTGRVEDDAVARVYERLIDGYRPQNLRPLTPQQACDDL